MRRAHTAAALPVLTLTLQAEACTGHQHPLCLRGCVFVGQLVRKRCARSRRRERAGGRTGGSRMAAGDNCTRRLSSGRRRRRRRTWTPGRQGSQLEWWWTRRCELRPGRPSPEWPVEVIGRAAAGRGAPRAASLQTTRRRSHRVRRATGQPEQRQRLAGCTHASPGHSQMTPKPSGGAIQMPRKARRRAR